MTPEHSALIDKYEALLAEHAKLHADVNLLRDAIDRSNAALVDAIKTTEELTATTLQRQELQKVVDQMLRDHSHGGHTLCHCTAKRNDGAKPILCSKCGTSFRSSKHGSFLCEKCR